jgi:hypothetical protein
MRGGVVWFGGFTDGVQLLKSALAAGCTRKSSTWPEPTVTVPERNARIERDRVLLAHISLGPGP